MTLSLLLTALIACEKGPAPIVMDDVADTGDAAVDETPAGDDTEVADDTGTSPADDTRGETGGGETGGDTDTSPPVDTEVEVDVCDLLPDLPISHASTNGWSGAEDFTFDGEGYHVSVSSGNLLRRNRAGDEIVVRPGLGSAAGIHMMPDGERVVFANVSSNAIQAVSLIDGGMETLLSGLSYPNGIEVGLDGMIYVAEHSAGRVLQIDPETGATATLATDMYAPNGIAFGPEHNTLYWNSFGDGGIRAVTRDGDGWTDPFIVGAVPQSSTWWDLVGGDPCASAAAGDSCYRDNSQGGIGVCQPSPASDLTCGSIDTEVACDTLELGDACEHEVFGETIESACVESRGGGGPGGPSTTLICPVTSAERLVDCADEPPGAACELDADKGTTGTCERNWEGSAVCVDLAAETARNEEVCADLGQYEPCQVDGDFKPMTGACDYIAGTLTCGRVSTYGGSLDGLNVDECGNVYVTDFVDGGVWMIREGGDGIAEVVASLPSYWIPNLHWGNGVGGWETDVLYVADRGYGGSSQLFELPIVVGGAPEAFTPTLDDTGVTD